MKLPDGNMTVSAAEVELLESEGPVRWAGCVLNSKLVLPMPAAKDGARLMSSVGRASCCLTSAAE